MEASEVILEKWTLDNGHRVSPMLEGTVVDKITFLEFRNV